MDARTQEAIEGAARQFNDFMKRHEEYHEAEGLGEFVQVEQQTGHRVCGFCGWCPGC